MTVGELIEHLKTEDPGKLVMCFPMTYGDHEEPPKGFDVNWIPGINNLRNKISIRARGKPGYDDLVITFIPKEDPALLTGE